MTKHRFERRIVGEIILDLCFPCQGIWFDEHESLQVTPGGVIELFKLIHEHRDGLRQPLAEPLRCPRCKERLQQGMDIVKTGGKFNYHRCRQRHGRFTTFGQFMIEKGFVRQLNPAEIEALAAKFGTIRCSGCGAPVDIKTQSSCGHCASPIAILDSRAIEQALARYQHAEFKRTVPPDFEMLGDALTTREREKSHAHREPAQALPESLESRDLLIAGVSFLLGILSS